MKFSERIQRIQPSMTLAVDAKSKELRANGEDIIGFGAGEPDFDTPEKIKQAGIVAIETNMTHYTPVGGIDALKQAIVDKFERDNNLIYEKNQILVSCLFLIVFQLRFLEPVYEGRRHVLQFP